MPSTRVPGHIGFTVAPLALLAAPVLADEPFQWEVGAEYVDRTITIAVPRFGFVDGEFVPLPEPGTREDFDANTVVLSAQWFLEPVVAGSGPLERAPFVTRASRLSGVLLREDIDGLDGDTDLLALEGRYQANDDWFVTGTLGRVASTLGGADTDDTRFGLGVGRYVGDTTALSFLVERERFETSAPGFTFDDDLTVYTVGLEHLGDLGTTWQYAVDAALIVPDGEFDDAGMTAALTLYPTRRFAFGFDFGAAIDYDDDRPRNFGVFSRWFINDAWSVSARYEWADQNSGLATADDQSFTVGVRYRF